MSAARTLLCPNCGGPTTEGCRICDYCRAPIATVRCAYCFHMNVPDSVHCSGCGAVLGLEPVGAPGDVQCPACHIELDVFEGESGKLRDCRSCGGQFVEHALVRELIERREKYGPAVPRRARKWNPLLDPVRYLPCPICQSLMTRKNFGGSSGVIIDVCAAHGIWFDTGELPRILSFVESGGLAQARRREQELERARPAPESPLSLPSASMPESKTVTLAGHAMDLILTIAELLAKAHL